MPKYAPGHLAVLSAACTIFAGFGSHKPMETSYAFLFLCWWLAVCVCVCAGLTTSKRSAANMQTVRSAPVQCLAATIDPC